MFSTALNFKRFSLLVILCLTIYSLKATDPVKKDKEIIKNSAFSLNVHSAESSSLILTSSYNLMTDKLSLLLKEEVAFIEVLNKDGEIEFIFPVGDRKIHISLGQFEKGSYSINLLAFDKSNVISMDLNKTN